MFPISGCFVCKIKNRTFCSVRKMKMRCLSVVSRIKTGNQGQKYSENGYSR